MAFGNNYTVQEVSDIFREADRVHVPCCEVETSLAYVPDAAEIGQRKHLSLVVAHNGYELAKNSAGELISVKRAVEYGLMSCLEINDPE